MRPTLLVAVLAAGLIAGTSVHAPAQAAPAHPQATPAAQAVPSAAAPAGATQPEKYVVPAGTRVLLSLKSAINTKTAQPGDGVYLISNFPVVVDGHVLIPDGVYVQGVVDRVQRPGRVKGRAQISMHFTTLIFPDGKAVPIPGVVNSLPGSAGPAVKGKEGVVEQAGTKGRDAGTVVKGAEIGAGVGTIGGIAGGSVVKGIGYGGLAGAAAGAITTLFTRGNDVVIPAGASVEMVLQRPMALVPQQYAVVNSPAMRMPQQFDPTQQQQPMQKPEPIVCPTGVTNCH